MKYKVLTLTPPWGTLIAIGAKRIETRGWSTQHRGTLLIHQGSNLKPIGGREGYLDQCRKQPFFTELIRHKPNQGGMFYDDDYFMGLPMGKIVAVCRLTDCRSTTGKRGEQGTGPKYADWVHDLTERERAFGNYDVGRYAWLLADVRALPTPIAARGLPGLWDWEGELGL